MIKPTATKADTAAVESNAAPTLEEQARAEVQALTGATDATSLEARVEALEKKATGYECALAHICGRMGVTLSSFLTE